MSGVLTIGLAYLLAATAASVLFVLVAWGTQNRPRHQAVPLHDMPPPHAAAPTTGAAPQADVATAAAAALRRLSPLLDHHTIRIQTAVPPGLHVRLSPERLAALIEELLATVVNAEPWAHLLLSAERHGPRVDILLSDDCPMGDAALWQSLCRDLTERVALLGGSLDIQAASPHGTTMVLRLAAPIAEHALEAATQGAPAADPAARKTAAEAEPQLL